MGMALYCWTALALDIKGSKAEVAMLRRPVMLLTLCLMSGMAGVAGAQSHDDSRLAPEERAYVASKIYSLIPVFFAHGEGSPNLDLDAAYKQYLAQALATDGRREFDPGNFGIRGQARQRPYGLLESLDHRPLRPVAAL